MWNKKCTLPFVAPKSNLFLMKLLSYYLIISIKIFLLIMHQIHRDSLIPFASDQESVYKEKIGAGAGEEEAEDDNTAIFGAEH